MYFKNKQLSVIAFILIVFPFGCLIYAGNSQSLSLDQKEDVSKTSLSLSQKDLSKDLSMNQKENNILCLKNKNLTQASISKKTKIRMFLASNFGKAITLGLGSISAVGCLLYFYSRRKKVSSCNNTQGLHLNPSLSILNFNAGATGGINPDLDATYNTAHKDQLKAVEKNSAITSASVGSNCTTTQTSEAPRPNINSARSITSAASLSSHSGDNSRIGSLHNPSSSSRTGPETGDSQIINDSQTIHDTSKFSDLPRTGDSSRAKDSLDSLSHDVEAEKDVPADSYEGDLKKLKESWEKEWQEIRKSPLKSRKEIWPGFRKHFNAMCKLEKQHSKSGVKSCFCCCDDDVVELGLFSCCNNESTMICKDCLLKLSKKLNNGIINCPFCKIGIAQETLTVQEQYAIKQDRHEYEEYMSSTALGGGSSQRNPLVSSSEGLPVVHLSEAIIRSIINQEHQLEDERRIASLTDEQVDRLVLAQEWNRNENLGLSLRQLIDNITGVRRQ